jgi:hypothetical protein
MRSIARSLLSGLLFTAMATGAGAQPPHPAGIPMKVYKTATCGCCQKWVDHVKAAGFAPAVEEVASVDPMKDKAGVPAALRSCHTALVQGYVIEGHVPADVIHRLLKEKPKVLGIAVPGMPAGSPGMEMGDRKDAYEIVAFTRDGKTTVYDKR